MLDRVSNPGPLTYEQGALPTALRGTAAVRGRGWAGGGEQNVYRMKRSAVTENKIEQACSEKKFSKTPEKKKKKHIGIAQERIL